MEKKLFMLNCFKNFLKNSLKDDPCAICVEWPALLLDVGESAPFFQSTQSRVENHVGKAKLKQELRGNLTPFELRRGTLPCRAYLYFCCWVVVKNVGFSEN